jgi:tRNA threonylcarbamoyladenosine biosynthesis protein TsaB
MILTINTTKPNYLEVSLSKTGKIVYIKKVQAKKLQAEKLLITIDKLLKSKNIDFKNIEAIKVANKGGSFTSLRIGVLTANTLAYAWKIPVYSLEGKTNLAKGFKLVSPVYDRDPDIYKDKSN